MKKLCITVDDEGAVAVGLEPQDSDPQSLMEGQDYMEPVESIEAALAKGAELLGGDEEPDEEGFAEGFERAAEGGAMMNRGMGVKPGY